MVREKSSLFEIYRQKDQEVKMITGQKKNEVDERDGIQLSRKFRENKKLFWSDVNMKRKERAQMNMRVRDNDGNIVTDASDVKQR